MRRGGALVPVLLAVTGGLLVAGAATANWYEAVRERDVADIVVVQDVEATTGAQLVPLLLPLGVAALLLAAALAFAGPRARRALGALLAAAGLLAAGMTIWAAVPLGALPGHITPAPGLSLAGAVALLAAGALAAARATAAPHLPARYSVEGHADEDDDEWRAAVDDAQ